MAKDKELTLSVKWSKRENDFLIESPSSVDGRLIFYAILTDQLRWKLREDVLQKSNYEIFNFIKELEERGYDLKTLKFSIQKKKQDKTAL